MGAIALSGPLAIITTLFNIDIEDKILFTPVIIGAIFGFYSISRYRVEIDDQNVTIPNSILDFRKHGININSIIKIRLDIGVGSKEKKSYYTLRLIGKKTRIQINIKLFSKNDIILLINYINQLNDRIIYDEFTSNLLDDNFKPIVQEGIKGFWSVLKYLILPLLLIFLYFIIFN